MAKTHDVTATFTTNTTQDFDVSAYDTGWLTGVLSGTSGALAANVTPKGSGARQATEGFVDLASRVAFAATAPSTGTNGVQIDLRGVRTLQLDCFGMSGTGASLAITVGLNA